MKLIKLVAILGIATLTGCGVSSETTSTTSTTTINVDDILGSWERELSFPGEPGSETIVIDFIDDGTCTIGVIEEGEESWSCEYSADGVNFTITDAGCDGDSLGEGSYTYTITQDILTFSLVSDPCEDRVMGLTGDWDRL